jgi:hypothetical protein
MFNGKCWKGKQKKQSNSGKPTNAHSTANNHAPDIATIMQPKPKNNIAKNAI